MRRLSFAVAALGFVLAAAPANAELVRITPLGFSPAGYAGQTDPVLIGPDGFRLTYHSQGGGNNSWVNPVELILAIPDGLVAPVFTVSDSPGLTVAVDLGGTSTMYGGSWDTSTGFAGTFTGSPISKVYDFIGFTPKGSASENFSNWSDYSGFNSWNLFVYALAFTPQIMPGQYVEFLATPDLLEGTYVIGYGQEKVKKGTCGNPSCAQSTPFTFAGYVEQQQVPEPGSAVLVALGIAVVGARLRKRNRLA